MKKISVLIDNKQVITMTKEITSKIIGHLKQDKRFPDWWKSNDFKIPLFDNKILSFTYTDFEPESDETFIKDVDKALINFFELTNKDRYSLSDLAYKNCMDFIDSVGSDDFDIDFSNIVDRNEIWRYIHPKEIYISRRYRRDKEIYIQIACECNWEEEHGLQLIFKQGKKLTRISGQDGHLTDADAYNRSDEEDELLSKF